MVDYVTIAFLNLSLSCGCGFFETGKKYHLKGILYIVSSGLRLHLCTIEIK